MLIQSSSVLTVSGVDFSVGMCLIIMPQTLRRTESPADRFHAEPVPVWNSKRHRALTTQHIYNTINSITHLNRGHLGNKRAGDRQWNHQELCCNKKRNKIYVFLLTIKPSLMSNLASSGGCDFYSSKYFEYSKYSNCFSESPIFGLLLLTFALYHPLKLSKSRFVLPMNSGNTVIRRLTNPSWLGPYNVAHAVLHCKSRKTTEMGTKWQTRLRHAVSYQFNIVL